MLSALENSVRVPGIPVMAEKLSELLDLIDTSDSEVVLLCLARALTDPCNILVYCARSDRAPLLNDDRGVNSIGEKASIVRIYSGKSAGAGTKLASSTLASFQASLESNLRDTIFLTKSLDDFVR
jgi:hypothetical protein